MCVFITDKSSSVDEKGRYSDTQTTTERPKATVERLVFDSETNLLQEPRANSTLCNFIVSCRYLPRIGEFRLSCDTQVNSVSSLRRSMGAGYCDEHVSGSVILSVCPRAYL